MFSFIGAVIFGLFKLSIVLMVLYVVLGVVLILSESIEDLEYNDPAEFIACCAVAPIVFGRKIVKKFLEVYNQ